jgi:beta-galactosidase GanA
MEFRPPYLGAAYYPEDWPLEQIDDDIALMKDAGMNVMRIGEFAWSRMEPEEGRFDFDWLHLVVDKLGHAGIAVIMGTPTCTPPVWLTERYPEVLFTQTDGTKVTHGARRHACPNSPVYRDHCARIVTKMAEEFGKSEYIIGWQIDNEIYSQSPHGVSCACPVCVRKFRETMREKFGTIETLNATWGTDLWSQTYQSFDQLPTPDPSIWHHPSLLTAWAQFNSDSYVEFAKHQADILHKLVDAPVGTDMMPFAGVHYGDINRFLDVVQYNHYNDMSDLWKTTLWFDLCRSLKDRPFWNTETATVWNGSHAANGYREPGFCTVNSWLPIAMGAEANLYWLWRSHWSGQELMHGSVVSSAGRPLHVMKEVQELARGFEAASNFLNDTKPVKTGLALHYSHLASWMFRYQPLIRGFDYAASMLEQVYRPMIQAQFRPDVILPEADLSAYKLIITPFMPTLDDEGLRARLKDWIEAGGTWIAGPFTDIRTKHATKFPHGPYGSLEEWAGVYCKYEVPGEPRDFGIRWSDGRESTGSLWYDILELRGAEAIATYSEGEFEGYAAITHRKMGKGQVILLGTLPKWEDLQALLRTVGEEVNIAPAADASENLMVVPRSGNGGSGMVIVEIEHKPGYIVLPTPMTDLLTGESHQGRTEIAPYTVMVLQG